MTSPDQASANLHVAASQLTAYLATPNLPDRVEMSCLLAADELRRAGGPTLVDLPPAVGPAGVGVGAILDTLLDLPPALFATAPVLNAVAHLNAAADALLAV